MKVLVAGAKKAQIRIIDNKNNRDEIVEYNTEINKCAELLRERNCHVVEVECESQFLNALENNPDLDGVIIDASFCGGKTDSLDVFSERIMEKKLVASIIETQPSVSDHFFASFDGIKLVPLPLNTNLQKDLDSFRESGKWKAWAKHWVFNDAGDAVYLLLQDIYPGFSSEWWFAKTVI